MKQDTTHSQDFLGHTSLVQPKGNKSISETYSWEVQCFGRPSSKAFQTNSDGMGSHSENVNVILRNLKIPWLNVMNAVVNIKSSSDDNTTNR